MMLDRATDSRRGGGRETYGTARVVEHQALFAETFFLLLACSCVLFGRYSLPRLCRYHYFSPLFVVIVAAFTCKR